MRVREFISENWWDDLDDSMLTMMGYAISPLQPESDPNLEIKAAIKDIHSES